MSQVSGAGARPADDLLTVDELTQRVGISVRNVRFYTTRGLIPPPIRSGRVGYYTADHVVRLELVQELQAHGFTLAAIEQYLAGIPADATPGEVALRSTMLAPWHSDRPVLMTHEELEKRADHALGPDDVETLIALGVVARRADADDQYDVAASQVSVGLGLLELGFPLEAARAAAEVYHRHGHEIAHELYDVFRRLAWPAYKEAGMAPEDVQGVVERLKPLSIASLVAAYEQGMDETKREGIEKRSR